MMNNAHTPSRAAGLRSEIPIEFVGARVRGRRSTMYEGDRLAELSRVNTVRELGMELYPGRDFRDQFQLERHMTTACAEELASFLTYVDGALGELYLALIRSFAVEDLKTLLRLVLAGSRQDAEDLLVELPEEMEIPVEALADADDAAEFVERLP